MPRASFYYYRSYDTFLCHYTLPMLALLLQVGVSHSYSLKLHLAELQMVTQAYLQQGGSQDEQTHFQGKVLSICQMICSDERTEGLDQQKAFPIDRLQQMAHLKEFSDHTLDVYPKELNGAETKPEILEQTLKMISDILHFLNQPHTLQWYCRVCLRENLVSLSPSVIRTLPVPAALKRYILCHEL